MGHEIIEYIKKGVYMAGNIGGLRIRGTLIKPAKEKKKTKRQEILVNNNEPDPDLVAALRRRVKARKKVL